MAYNGYYIKINGCDFTNPKPSGYICQSAITQDLDSERSADGTLHRNILPHKPPKIELTFPPMKESQYRIYRKALEGDYLQVEFYDTDNGTYRTWTMYHNDIKPETINTADKINRWIGELKFNLIGY